MAASISESIALVGRSEIAEARSKASKKKKSKVSDDHHHHHPAEEFAAPPGASERARKMAMRVRGPVDHFLHTQTSGGIVLLFTAALALIWANSPWSHSYHDLWHTPIHFAAGSFAGHFNLHFLINDGLMTIFFLVVGLEIKRELVEGELSDIRRASLPIAAAVGGMLAPALIYYVLNPSAPASAGWGVPMATDIAFAVGILSLLGNRVPAAMRILLLALAIIDDLGAILVIALFYTADFNPGGLGVAAVGVAVLFLWVRVGIRPGPMYLVPLGIIWAGFLSAGVHPTLAGVIVGLATPVRPWLSKEQFGMVASDSIKDFEERMERGADDHEILEPIHRLTFAAKEAVSPVVRGVGEMHIWVAFGIMPVFALANAGVDLGGVDFAQAGAMKVMLGVTLGLALGKPLGVMLISWIFVRTGLAALPKGLAWSGILIIGLTAGIGFTMAIFIAELAFASAPHLLGLAKLAILIGTAGAAIVGLVVGFIVLKPMSEEIAQLSATDVERSTEY